MIFLNRSMCAMALILAMAVGPEASLAQTAAPAPPASAPTPVGAVALKPDQVALLRQALDQAPAQGFSDRAFTPEGLEALLQSTDPAGRQRGEALLKAAVLRYASAVHRGRLPAADFDDEWGLRPAAYDPAPDFAAAVAQNRVAEWLSDLPPAYAGYKQLVKALADYRAIAAKGGWQTLPGGKPLKPARGRPRRPASGACRRAGSASRPWPRWRGSRPDPSPAADSRRSPAAGRPATPPACSGPRRPGNRAPDHRRRGAGPIRRRNRTPPGGRDARRRHSAGQPSSAAPRPSGARRGWLTGAACPCPAG